LFDLFVKYVKQIKGVIVDSVKCVDAKRLQLQQLVSEESCLEMWELQTRERLKGGGGGHCRTAHQRHHAEANYLRLATHALQGDNAYKMYIVSI
jgi:hypothetical protein